MITLVMEWQLENKWRSLVVLGQTSMVKFSNVNLTEQGKEGKQFIVNNFLVSKETAVGWRQPTVASLLVHEHVFY